MAAASSVVAASRKHVELSLELKRKLIQEHEHGVPFTLLGKKYHIATSTAANIWRKKDFFLRSRMSGSRKRCNDRSKYKIVNQVTALFVKSMLERNHKIDGEVIKRFARTAAAQCKFKDFHGSNGWLDSFKKRENVCWVRRRGGSAVSDRNPAMAPSQAALIQQQQQSQRSDSPNLSAAAAAAAMAATNQRHQHQHRPGSPLGGAWMDDNEPQHTCARCNVAAAAAAVAALNASDSIHERDHEIEDWFHGIPFLCQFFEEYQSMHLSDSSSSGSSGSSGVSSGVSGTSSSNGNQPSSSGSSSSASSVQAAPLENGVAASGCGLNGSTSLQLQFQSDPPVRSLSDAHELALDPMGDCGSSASSLNQFRASASLADIQQVATGCGGDLQRTIPIEMFVQDSSVGQMNDEPSSASSCERQQQQYEVQANSLQHQSSASSEQLMEISFQQQSSTSQQQVTMMQTTSNSHKPICHSNSDNMNATLDHQMSASEQDISAPNNNNNNNNNNSNQQCQHTSDHHHQSQQQHQQPDYAKVEDLEFYLPPSHSRYIPQDAQSTDDLLSYHDDQVSDHNDCCSDHYEQVSGLQLQVDQQQQVNGHACYMDEYEYENISTIRHYPVTAASMMQHQQPAQVSTASCLQHFALSSTGSLQEANGCLQQRQQQQQQHQQQQQQQQVSCDLGTCEPAGGSSQNQLMKDAFLSPNSPPPTASSTGSHRATNGYLENSCKNHSSLAAMNGAVEFHLAEQEPAVEHADHEEHNLLHNALMRSPEKLKLIDSIITLLNYASNYNHKMIAPLLDIKRCIERDLEVVLSDTSSENQRASTSGAASCCNDTRQRQIMRRLLEAPSSEQQQATGKTFNGNNHLDGASANSNSNNNHNNHLEVSVDQQMQP